MLVQCRYSEMVQRIFKYSNTQYTSLTLDKNRTVWYIEGYSMSVCMGLTNFQKQSVFWPTLYLLTVSWNGDVSLYQLHLSKPIMSNTLVRCIWLVKVCSSILRMFHWRYLVMQGNLQWPWAHMPVEVAETNSAVFWGKMLGFCVVCRWCFRWVLAAILQSAGTKDHVDTMDNSDHVIIYWLIYL